MNEIMRKSLQKIKEEQAKLKAEIWEKTVGYIVGALGLVAGLAWNDAIKNIIESIFPMKAQSIWAKLLYAVIVTVLIVMVSVYLVRLTKPKEESKQ